MREIHSLLGGSNRSSNIGVSSFGGDDFSGIGSEFLDGDRVGYFNTSVRSGLVGKGGVFISIQRLEILNNVLLSVVVRVNSIFILRNSKVLNDFGLSLDFGGFHFFLVSFDNGGLSNGIGGKSRGSFLGSGNGSSILSLSSGFGFGFSFSSDWGGGVDGRCVINFSISGLKGELDSLLELQQF